MVLIDFAKTDKGIALYQLIDDINTEIKESSMDGHTVEIKQIDDDIWGSK